MPTDELSKAIKRPFVLDMTSSHSPDIEGFQLYFPLCNLIIDTSAKITIHQKKNLVEEELNLNKKKMIMMSFSTIFLSIFPKQNILGKFQQMSANQILEMIAKKIPEVLAKEIKTSRRQKD